VNRAEGGYVEAVPELATLAAFLFLAALLVYVILQVPLAARDDGPDIDLAEEERIEADPAAFRARLVLVRPGLRTVTIDGMTADRGELFAFEVGRPEGWAREDADRQLRTWADSDAVVEVRVRDDVRGSRAWISCGQAAMDLPLAGRLGAPSQS
jgi:hypothetical protein